MKSKVSVKVVLPEPVPSFYRLTLNLSHQDAAALCRLCDHIGGNPENSPRKLFDEIKNYLLSVGVVGCSKSIENNVSGIRFTEYSKIRKG